MGKHVVVGAGQVGAHLARLLAGQGHEVTVVTRSGSGPDGVTKVAADAADRERLTEAAKGAEVIFNCMNPRYPDWAKVWPPVSASLLATAEATGAVLVTLGNLYGYGPVDGTMTEDTPLAATGHKGKIRNAMWRDMLAAHKAGRVRVTELRGSDYFGPGTRDQAYIGTDRFVRPLLAGKRVQFVGDPDQPHSWTYVPDVARALAIAGTDERAWGRAWHIPTSPAMTAREVGERLCTLAGAPAPRISAVPDLVVSAIGLVSPLMRELKETRYQFNRPYHMDSSAFEATFGMAPTPMEQALTETISAHRAE